MLFLAGTSVCARGLLAASTTAPIWMFYVLIAVIGGLIYGLSC